MEDHERPSDRAILAAISDLGGKLDTVAGAVVSMAGTHHDLLDHVAEIEARRGEDAAALSLRLEALERQILTLGTSAPEASPVRAEEVIRALQSISDQLPDLSDDVTRRLSDHTDTALAAVLRLLDGRLAMLRQVLTEGDPSIGGRGMGAGFEAGAVMGAAQAAWSHLEQRLDAEFDDLGRQLQSMAAMIETVAASTDDLVNRPMTGDQIRKAASVVMETVVSANRTRRDRRGGPRSLGS